MCLDNGPRDRRSHAHAFCHAGEEWLADGRGKFSSRATSGHPRNPVTLPIAGKPIPANGGTIGFAASSPEQVKAWHDAGVAAGGKSIEDAPGVREAAAGKLYIAYLRDLGGNKICALHRIG